MSDVVLRITDFGGGLNLSQPRTLIAANESSDLKNVVFDEAGLLEKRKGYQKLNTVALAAAKVTGLHRYYKQNGTKRWLATCGTLLRSIQDDGTLATLYTAGTAFGDVQFATWKDLGFVIDQNAGLIKTNLSSTSVIAGAPAGKSLVLHHQRLFAAGTSANPSRLYWSDDGDETTWGGASYIDFDADDGDRIVGMAPLMGDLWVFKQNSIHRLYGTAPADFARQRAWGGVGCIAPRSILAADNGIYFAARDGLKLLDGAGVHHVSVKVDPEYLAAARTSEMVAARWKQYLWLAYSSSGASLNDRVLVLDTRRGAWTKFQGIGANALAVADGIGDSGALFFGAAGATGICYQANATDADDGAAIEMYYSTKQFDIGLPEVVKRFRRLWVDFLADGATAYIDYEVERGAHSGTLEVTGTSGDQWGAFNWDSGTWAAATEQSDSTSLSASMAGRFLRFIVRNNDTEPAVKIYSIAVQARPIRLAS